MRILLTIVTTIAMTMSVMADAVSDLRPAIQEAAAKHDVDPVLMEAIMRHESAHGTSSAAKKKNNLAGIMGRKGQRRYESKEACVHDLARLLSEYKAKGRVTVAQIGRAYCSSTGEWTRRVNAHMSDIRKGRYGELPAEKK